MTKALKYLARNVEMHPEPGPISMITLGAVRERSCSSASRRRNVSSGVMNMYLLARICLYSLGVRDAKEMGSAALKQKIN